MLFLYVRNREHHQQLEQLEMLRDLGFRDLGFRDLGFRDLGFRDFGFQMTTLLRLMPV